MSSHILNTDEEQQVRSWGFHKVFTRLEPPHAHYKAHKHDYVSTHYILSGTFIVCYPELTSEKEHYGPGDRIDVPVAKLHEVWIGADGCELVIGE